MYVKCSHLNNNLSDIIFPPEIILLNPSMTFTASPELKIPEYEICKYIPSQKLNCWTPDVFYFTAKSFLSVLVLKLQIPFITL